MVQKHSEILIFFNTTQILQSAAKLSEPKAWFLKTIRQMQVREDMKMNTNKKTTEMKDTKALLSTLWIVVLINMAFADIFSFMFPETLEEIMTGSAAQFPITQEIMLVFAIVMEIPIAMIFLSRILKYRANRWANIIVSATQIAFVWAAGSAYLHYIFFAAIETVCMSLIIWNAWKWSNPEA